MIHSVNYLFLYSIRHIQCEPPHSKSGCPDLVDTRPYNIYTYLTLVNKTNPYTCKAYCVLGV